MSIYEKCKSCKNKKDLYANTPLEMYNYCNHCCWHPDKQFDKKFDGVELTGTDHYEQEEGATK
ncbi:hypothetical protein SDC9_120963 [bioreactor metagenome]|uniref:Uncharacterized protein n=1 Tax=bioreactor metagenome TaxID=1076179 RepID=A0A645CAP9_9ZZZZ